MNYKKLVQGIYSKARCDNRINPLNETSFCIYSEGFYFLGCGQTKSRAWKTAWHCIQDIMLERLK